MPRGVGVGGEYGASCVSGKRLWGPSVVESDVGTNAVISLYTGLFGLAYLVCRQS